MIITTTATSIDWEFTQIDIADDRLDQYFQTMDSPDHYDLFQQGIQEGWITLIGPVQ